MKLGTMVSMDMERLDGEFAALRAEGFETCQLCCWNEEAFTHGQRQDGQVAHEKARRGGVGVLVRLARPLRVEPEPMAPPR